LPHLCIQEQYLDVEINWNSVVYSQHSGNPDMTDLLPSHCID